jgi:lipoprotein-anchoring transpeptidase ErfK/SrfK
MKRLSGYLICVTACLLAIGCTAEPTNQATRNVIATPAASATSSPSASPAVESVANEQPLTLPVLDAFFADKSFPNLLTTRLQLTDEQIAKLKELAHSETAKLNDATSGRSEGETAAARATAEEKISSLIGSDKASQLAALVRERWSDGTEPGATANAKTATEKTVAVTTNPQTPEEFAARAPNTVPTDSRIIVNAPAFRMDVFEGGRLIKSYKIGIGYPQFPLPTALRKARSIIFNPTWTPPDEPWVAKMKNVTVGEKVEAGSELNPLGPIKIPIGLPSLIHGGKSPAKLGTFASHGCVGLTTPQVQDFAKLLAQLGGARLTDADLARYARDKTQTKQIKLGQDVPVELRYETIVVEDGKLHIYRDVYDQDTNTEEDLNAVLAAHGVRREALSEEERAQVLDALAQMAGKSSKKIVRPATVTQPSPALSATPLAANALTDKNAAAAKKPARKRNVKEIVIEIAALSGKGYPAPVELDTGTGRKAKATSVSSPKKT